MNRDNNITVSVCCQTYNHKEYITKTLDSILMQKTNFVIEILLRDDASTDGTTAICKKYAENYPDKINLLVYDENQWQLGVSPFRDNVLRAKGKYIAICEGDDYWIDPLKLQKQVDFLEANDNYGFVHTDTNVYHQNSGKLVENINRINKRNLVQLDNPAEDLILGHYRIYTLSVLFKSALLDNIDMKSPNKFKMGDLPLWLTFTKFTKFYYLNESTAVYRKNEGSASNPLNKRAKLDFKISSKEVRLYFAKSLNLNTATVNQISDQYNRALLRKKFEDKESAMASKTFYSIRNKSYKDCILLLGCKSKMFNNLVMKVWPQMS